ncbi:hypothetical protein [Roseovarius sp. Pro17]|uniref:hypothetical protein n=1 Tax=Roseovarius sp. Pro17 TaxID=3108175 RepID=UPI002D7965F5|nr:hypothetical protein [Roseovarius sp. Pro17]
MNYYAIGFGAVALTALGAIDYANQASAAGESPGRFSAGAYFSTFGARVDGVREARADAAANKERDLHRRAGARAYLPDAPEGWIRRAWLEGDNSAILMPEEDDMRADAQDLLKNLAAKSARAAEERRESETWVYQQAERVIAVRAEYKPRKEGRSLTGAVADTLNASGFFNTQGWAVIGGVAYGQTPPSLQDSQTPLISQAGTPFRAFEAPLGFHDAVQLSVLTNADDDELRAVLAAIDYDGLNALLAYPLPYVGATAPDVPLEAQPRIAEIMLEMHSDLLSRRSAEAQAWMERATSPENAMEMILNELAHGWGADGIVQLDMDDPPAPTPSNDETAQAPSVAAVAEFARSLFGGAKDTPDAEETAKAKAKDTPKPGRLTLSGGTSCLEGSSGRFCRD